MHVDFYFDFISPYAYFASRRIGRICASRGATLSWRPVLLAGLLKHGGQLGPAEVPAKRVFTFKDITRHARLHGIPLVGPPIHPFKPLTALRLALAEVSGERQPELINALFDACWARGRDLQDPGVLAEVLADVGLDPALLEQTVDPAVKRALFEETASAIEQGVFGVPTAICNGELFWGNDRLHHLELYLDGTDLLQDVDVDQILARPGVHRPR